MKTKLIQNLTYQGSRDKPIVMDVSWDEDHDSLPVVILAHGYKGFKDWGAWHLVMDELVKAGFLFIKFNFSYNGGTPEQPIDFPDLEAFGNNNYTTEIGDFKRVIDFVEQSNVLPRQKLDINDLTIIGHSRGGGMAILTAHQDERVKKLITWASISDLERRQPQGAALKAVREKGVMYVKNGRTKQDMPHYYQMQEDYIQHKASLDIPKAASELNMPWLIIHGDSDKAVPFSEAEELKHCNANAQLITIEDCNHTFGARHPHTDTGMPKELAEVVKETIAFMR